MPEHFVFLNSVASSDSITVLLFPTCQQNTSEKTQEPFELPYHDSASTRYDPLIMVRIKSPDQAEPELDIRLSQNPNEYFHPASTISGQVTYTNHYGSKNYDLLLIFSGVNKITLKNGMQHITEKATLFEYAFTLHTATTTRYHKTQDGSLDTGPYEFSFRHRFPSATDNRSFNVMGGTMINTAFSNHVHDLPPTYEAHSNGKFKCSVEYSLRAELHIDKALKTSYSIPIMFMPYAKAIHGARSSPKFLYEPDAFTNHSLRKIRKDSLVDHYADTWLPVGIEMPSEIKMGRPFTFDVCVQLENFPEFDEDIPAIKVLYLIVVFTTKCRALHSAAQSDNADSERKKEKIITLHPDQSNAVPSLDRVTNKLSYLFYAVLPTYYPPSFRSFLVSNNFRFDSMTLVVDGRKRELPMRCGEVFVLSPVVQPTGIRRSSTMILNPRANSVVYGRT